MLVHEEIGVPHKKKFFDFFPAPKFIMLSTEGVAISETAIQFVQFGKATATGGLELVHCAEAQIAPGLVVAGTIQDRKALVKDLVALRERFKVQFVHATLPEERVYLFTVVLEKVPFDNLRDAVAFTIEDNAPVKLAESIFDFEIVGETEGKSEIRVAVSVLPIDVVESYVSVFEEAGIVPISFDIESQAMARALIPRDDNHSHLIVNLGSKKTGLYVAEEEVVQFSSTLPIGFIDQGASDELKGEMRKLFAFWNTRVDKHGRPEGRIEAIIFTGLGAKEEFVKTLMSGIEIGYSIGNVWANAFGAKESPAGVPFAESLDLGAAVGAALPIREVDYI